MNIKELKKEYAEQDNRMTAYPIYVRVQELVCIGVMANGYDVYGDGEAKTEYLINYNGDHDSYDTKEDAIDALKEQYEDDKKGFEQAVEDIEELNMGYIWHTVEFFLTIKGAEAYMKANKHNHGKLRTYVDHFERRNFEMRELLSELRFKTNDSQTTKGE